MLPTGFLVPGHKEFKIFTPSIYQKKIYLILDIIRLIIVFIFMFLMGIDIYEKHKQNIKFVDAFFVPKTYLNLSLLIIYCFTFVTKFAYCNKSEKEFFKDGKSYTDSFSLAENYEILFMLDSINFLLILIKFLSVFKLNTKIGLLYLINESAIIIFSKYLIFFIPVLIGFASVSQILWGEYLSNFETFGKSFLQILLFTAGKYYTQNFRLF